MHYDDVWFLHTFCVNSIGSKDFLFSYLRGIYINLQQHKIYPPQISIKLNNIGNNLSK